MVNSAEKLPNIGDIIYYKLCSGDSPIEPDKKWKGKVILAVPETSRSVPCVKVESLEDGYEGLTEFVMLSQIVEIAT
ncbi:MAG TPA: hypothetical protein VF043_10085 [Ktedonobacteraceae bacterium]